MARGEGFGYVTAPCSPIRSRSVGHVYLYSVPTSPTTKLSPCEGAKSYVGEFEFETSCRFDSGPEKFAEELFRDGKVVPVSVRPPPLKLPPRLQHVSDSTPSTLSSRGIKVKHSSFSRWREDDSDPFTKAMEKVSKDRRRKSSKTRRARSLSPSRASNLTRPQQHVNNMSGPIILMQGSRMDQEQGCSKSMNVNMMLGEAKGASFARRLRLVKMGQEAKGSSKRHKIKEFLFRTPSVKPNGDSGALVQYRPSLFLCLGYGMKKSIF